MRYKPKMEALRRMAALKLHDEGPGTCVEEFRHGNNPWKSEFYGILYWLDEEEKQLVKDFETKYAEFDMHVYHCYRAHTKFGEILYMLFVSNQEDEPEMFDEDLSNGIIYCYAANISEPNFSEFGTAYIQSKFGGIELK